MALDKVKQGVIADDAVGSSQIAPDTVVAADIGANAITASELADNAVDSAAIAANPTIVGLDLQQQSSKAVTGTISSKQVLTGDSYSLTGDLTINSQVKLGTISATEDAVLMSDSTSANRTITGTGTLEIGSVSASHESSDIIAGGLTANADISEALDNALADKNIRRNVLIGYNRNRYGKRASVNNGGEVTLWYDAVTLKRKYSDTHIHIQGEISGAGKYSYPLHTTWTMLVCPSGHTIKKYEGNHYVHSYYADGEVHWSFNVLFYPQELRSEVGSYEVRIGWGPQADGSTNVKPIKIWNPDVNDDGRGYHTYSYANIYELYLGEHGYFDNRNTLGDY